jgi:type I restriction enzyme S subunit
MSAWISARLRDVGVELIDCVHNTPQARPYGYPYITIPQMKNGRIDFSTARLISREDFIEWTKKAKPRQFDIVLSRRTNPGVTAIDQTNTEFALGQNLVLLRSDGSNIYPPFLAWMTRSTYWWEQVSKFNNVGAVFDSLKCADVPNFELPVPPYDAQRSISELLGALDDKIELNRRMNETLEAMAQAIFRDWFVDFGPTRAKVEGRAPYLAPEIWSLFPNQMDGEGKPVGWRDVNLEDICSRIAIGPFGSSITTDNFVASGVPVIRGNNLKAGFVDSGFVYLKPEKAVELKNASVKSGDIVITHRGTLGQIGIIPNNSKHKEYIISQSQMMVRANDDLCTNLFLYEFLRSSKGMDQLLSFTNQTGVPAIAQPTTSLKSLKLSLPSHSIISTFDNIAISLAAREEANKRESQTLAATRDLLLPKLMSGEIRVNEAERLTETSPEEIAERLNHGEKRA